MLPCPVSIWVVFSFFHPSLLIFSATLFLTSFLLLTLLCIPYIKTLTFVLSVPFNSCISNSIHYTLFYSFYQPPGDSGVNWYGGVKLLTFLFYIFYITGAVRKRYILNFPQVSKCLLLVMARFWLKNTRLKSLELP